jgi:Tfp pilus assembly protein PilF
MLAREGTSAKTRATEERMRTVVRTLAQALAISLLLSVIAGPGLSPTPAHAQAPASNKARARELYTQGQQLFRQGDFQTAQRSFEDAYRAVPNPVVLLSIAECQVRNEDFAAAVTTLRQYLNEKPNAPDRAPVEAQIANLEAKPGSVSIESAPAGAVIWVDGENTGYLTPNEISVRAGKHKISLSAPGYTSLEESVDVAIGSRQRLSLTLAAEPVAPVEEPIAAPSPVEEPSDSRGRRHGTPAVWASMAVAGVTGITGTALGVVALKDSKDYKKEPTRALSKKGDKLALFADVNFGIAIVAGVTALVLYLTSGQSDQPTDQAWMIAPEVSPSEVGLAGRMRF